MRSPLPLLVRVIPCLLLVVLVAGCGSVTPTPAPVSAPSGADGPGESTSASGGARANLAAFEAELREATARHGALVRSLAAASTGTPADLRAVVVQMRAWIQAERDWLTTHPADPCFEAATRRFSTSVDAMESSADWLSASVEASLEPSDDVSQPSARTEVSNDLQVAIQALVDATDAAKAARSSC